jgi:hypothetical protein
MITQIAGYLSAIAMLWSFVPYIRDIFKGNTKPERASWLIWAMLGAISFFSLLAKGASYSLFMPAAQGIGDLFIFILAIKFGMGGFMKRDIIALVGAAVGLFLWYLTKEPAVALFIAILIDAMGTTLTVIKSYEHPASETISNWVFVSIGGFFSCIAVGGYNLLLLVFPFYIFLAGLSVLISISLGFHHKKILSVENGK